MSVKSLIYPEITCPEDQSAAGIPQGDLLGNIKTIIAATAYRLMRNIHLIRVHRAGQISWTYDGVEAISIRPHSE